MENAELQNRATQPTMLSILEIVRDIRTRLESMDTRLATLETRLQAVETRLEGMDHRSNEAADDTKRRLIAVGNKMDALNRGRLQLEGDYSDLSLRISDLESKAS